MILLILLGLLGGTGRLGDTKNTIADWSPVGALMTLFSEVLAAAPQVKAIVTSRAPLRVVGE
jgi:hypothetical protein